VKEIQEAIPDELDLKEPAPFDTKILSQAIFFLPVEGCCAGFCYLTAPNLLSYLLNIVASSALTLVK
jgi:hypothetical protein